MKIAVSGAHGTGKTTLVEWISTNYNLPVIGERARDLLETKFSFQSVEDDLETFMQFQSAILNTQIGLEDEYESFVVDRPLIDSFVYVQERFSKERTLSSRYMNLYYDTLLQFYSVRPYDIILFIRPFERHYYEDDARNMSPAYVEVLDNLLAYHLFQGPFENVWEINTPSFEERVILAANAIGDIDV